MQRATSATEARVHFGDLLRKVVQGHEVVLGERGGNRRSSCHRSPITSDSFHRASEGWRDLAAAAGRRVPEEPSGLSLPLAETSSARRAWSAMNSSTICVDASSFSVCSLVPRLGRVAPMGLVARGGSTIHSPTLLGYEVTNALHRYRLAGLLSLASADLVLDAALSLPVRLHSSPNYIEGHYALRLTLPYRQHTTLTTWLWLSKWARSSGQQMAGSRSNPPTDSH